MKKTILILLILAGVVLAAPANINESDTALLQYRASVTGFYQAGNVSTFNIKGKGEITIAPSTIFALKTQNQYLYQEFYKTKADNDFYSRNFVYFLQYRRIYPFAMGFVSINYRRKVDFRYFVGPGVTFQLVKQKDHVLKVSLAGIYEATNFASSLYNYSEYNGSDKVTTWRANVWVFGKHKFFNNHLRLNYEAYVQPSLLKLNNFRWQVDASLEVPVWKGLNLTATYNFTHENVVIEKVKKDDNIFSFGFSYFGFTNKKATKPLEPVK